MTLSYRVARVAFRTLYATCFRWRVFHPERVPHTGAIILASNHASLLDPPLVGAGVDRSCHFLARDTLFASPLFGALLRSWQSVPVDREGGGAAGINGILDRLSRGGAVVLFPEGTRTRDGRFQQGRAGLGLVVMKSGAPVVPVRVSGTFAAWPRHSTLPRPRRIAVAYGEPLDFQTLRLDAQTASKAQLREIYQEIANRVMAAIALLEAVDTA